MHQCGMENFYERVVYYQLLPQPVLRSFSSVSAIKSSNIQRMVVVRGSRSHTPTQFSTPTKLIIFKQGALGRKVIESCEVTKTAAKNRFPNRRKSLFRGFRLLNFPRAMLFTPFPPRIAHTLGAQTIPTSLYSSLLGHS